MPDQTQIRQLFVPTRKNDRYSITREGQGPEKILTHKEHPVGAVDREGLVH